MDFLSFLSHHDSTDYKGTSLILHSTALRKRAIELIKDNKTKRITLFLDNDEAGRDTAEFFKNELPDLKVFDRAIQYGAFKDLNERLMNKRDGSIRNGQSVAGNLKKFSHSARA